MRRLKKCSRVFRPSRLCVIILYIDAQRGLFSDPDLSRGNLTTTDDHMLDNALLDSHCLTVPLTPRYDFLRRANKGKLRIRYRVSHSPCQPVNSLVVVRRLVLERWCFFRKPVRMFIIDKVMASPACKMACIRRYWEHVRWQRPSEWRLDFGLHTSLEIEEEVPRR